MQVAFVLLGLLALISTVVGVAKRLGKPITPIGLFAWGLGAISYFATNVKIVAGDISFGSPFDSTAAKLSASVMLAGMVLTLIGLALPDRQSIKH